MDYLIRQVQVHESFRKPEIEALATLAEVNVNFQDYCKYVRLTPVCTFKKASLNSVSAYPLLFQIFLRKNSLHFVSLSFRMKPLLSVS